VVTKRQIERLKKEVLQFPEKQVDDDHKQEFINKINKIAERNPDKLSQKEVLERLESAAEEEDDPIMKRILNKAIKGVVLNE